MDNKTFIERLDSVIWDAATWVAEFNALLDAIEVEWAIESELSADSETPPEL